MDAYEVVELAIKGSGKKTPLWRSCDLCVSDDKEEIKLMSFCSLKKKVRSKAGISLKLQLIEIWNWH